MTITELYEQAREVLPENVYGELSLDVAYWSNDKRMEYKIWSVKLNVHPVFGAKSCAETIAIAKDYEMARENLERANMPQDEDITIA